MDLFRFSDHPWSYDRISMLSIKQLFAIHDELTSAYYSAPSRFQANAYRETMLRIEDHVSRMRSYDTSIGSFSTLFPSASSLTMVQGALPEVIIQQQQQPQIVQAPAPPPQIVNVPAPAPRIVHVPAPQPQVIYETVDWAGRVVSRTTGPQAPGSVAAISTPVSAETDEERAYREWKERQP